VRQYCVRRRHQLAADRETLEISPGKRDRHETEGERIMRCRHLVAALLLLAMFGLSPAAAYASTPSNDERANAQSVVPGSTIFGTTVGATGSPDDPTCWDFVGPTIWYSFTATQSALMEYRIGSATTPDGASMNRMLWGPEGCDISEGPDHGVQFTTTPGTTYYFMVITALEGDVQWDLWQLSPSNDDFDAATVITTTPFDDGQWALYATKAADDPVPSCGPGLSSRTLWYSFVPQTDGSVGLSATPTSTTIATFVGSRGSLDEVGCSYGESLTIDVRAGTTYYFMIVARDDWVTLHLDILPSKPVLSITVNPVGKVTSAGVVTVGGTINCVGADYADANFWATQTNRRWVSAGGATTSVACSQAMPWSVSFTSSNGNLFLPGKATLSGNATACNAGGCASAATSAVVTLKPK